MTDLEVGVRCRHCEELASDVNRSCQAKRSRAVRLKWVGWKGSGLRS